jgi:hypothetical protein
MIKRIAVLLPEGKLFDQLFSEAIAPAVSGLECTVERLTAEFSSESQLGPICNAIERADLVIADLSTSRSRNLQRRSPC